MMLSTLGVLCYPAAIVAFVFVTLSLASGLLYVAEVIEEYSRTAKLIGRRTTYVRLQSLEHPQAAARLT